MINNSQKQFEAFEIEHDCTTYYANGYVDYTMTSCIGSNYEGYAFELLFERELCDVTITELWYYDKVTDDLIDIINQDKYRDIMELAEEEIRYYYE